ncbi:MAG TPA: hypothetical protein VMV46_18520, partial [Thermoanaerobaculia bacterium]|nr:hypothetical protein [Thermoanaerobaculia bacterium]
GPAARRRAPGALEIRRRVEHLFHRELAEPSEELVRFVRSRLDLDDGDRPAEETSELCRRALRDMGRERWSDADPAAGRRSCDRRQIDRRRFELHRELPGYYLG